MFADVAFPISGFQTFTYKIPVNLVKDITIGSRVKVQFGYRKTNGIIIGIKQKSSYSGEIKEISELVDDVTIMTPELWKLIKWMSHYYMTPVGKVATLVLPKNLSTLHSW